MHDKHGREINEGDIVAAHSWPHGQMRAQRVVVCNRNPAVTSCNVMLDHGVPGAPISSSNAKDCELVARADGSRVPEMKSES